MKPARRVRTTATFERSVSEIEQFLVGNDAPRAFDDLLAHLQEELVPNLERFPTLGREFLARRSGSIEVLTRVESMRKRTGKGEIREYLTGDYLLLYLDDGETVFLLSIRHHRQLSYDLPTHWE